MPSPAASICAAGTLRRATRSVARIYDAHLARAGLTTTQFSLLVPLEREGLVALTAGAGRSKQVQLTAKGVRRVADARPHWQSAQDAFLAEFGRSAWGGLAKQLAAIVDVARDIPAASE